MSLQGEARALRRRGLTEKICQKYKIFRDGENLRHYYYSKKMVSYLAVRSRPKTKTSGMKETLMDLFSGSIYGLVLENALLSQKENLMQHHVHKSSTDVAKC